ncbi:MAG: UDP-N-acetylmuramoyl-tripeptide--D-alanyl-D-alanine ligase [Rhodothermia bacterium]|nr:MAG: UDP-N-acetylmuramoyl-tripeptide--D-alanyl-D-alanine ligase [Rhodothermia bacterium]
MILSIVIAVSFCTWRIGRRLQFFGHILQLEGYKPANYFDWVRRRFGDVVLRVSHRLALSWIVVVVLLDFLFDNVLPPVLIPGFYLIWAMTFASSRRYRRDKPKKPLVFTFRMKRVLSLSAGISIALVAAGALPAAGLSGWRATILFVAGFLAADFSAPFAIYAAAIVLQPVEKAIQNGFKRAARRKLSARPDLDIIAVTGSYGKTSVKFAVEEVLAQRFSVLATPSSYNTPMGICKVVNNDLSPAHQVLILEMGIRSPGDIEELCLIAAPKIALVTSVGIAHLESMGSTEAIAKEKASLLQFTRSDGHAVLNADDEQVRSMEGQFPGHTWLVSCENHPDARIRASEIRFGPDGAAFKASDETGSSIQMHTRLVGRHNVVNILMAIAVGRIYGLRLRQIAQAVSRLTPVPHRLAVRREGAITVIDDAFNSNPVGARNAVEILGQLEARKRFIVTPGMIELGERQDDENRLLGHHIAKSADVAILVGERRTYAIAEGLREAEFPNQNIQIVQSLFEAKDFLNGALESGDVVLFENDLPDQFNES